MAGPEQRDPELAPEEFRQAIADSLYALDNAELHLDHIHHPQPETGATAEAERLESEIGYFVTEIENSIASNPLLTDDQKADLRQQLRSALDSVKHNPANRAQIFAALSGVYQNISREVTEATREYSQRQGNIDSMRLSVAAEARVRARSRIFDIDDDNDLRAFVEAYTDPSAPEDVRYFTQRSMADYARTPEGRNAVDALNAATPEQRETFHRRVEQDRAMLERAIANTTDGDLRDTYRRMYDEKLYRSDAGHELLAGLIAGRITPQQAKPILDALRARLAGTIERNTEVMIASATDDQDTQQQMRGSVARVSGGPVNGDAILDRCEQACADPVRRARLMRNLAALRSDPASFGRLNEQDQGDLVSYILTQDAQDAQFLLDAASSSIVNSRGITAEQRQALDSGDSARQRPVMLELARQHPALANLSSGQQAVLDAHAEAAVQRLANGDGALAMSLRNLSSNAIRQREQADNRSDLEREGANWHRRFRAGVLQMNRLEREFGDIEANLNENDAALMGRLARSSGRTTYNQGVNLAIGDPNYLTYDSMIQALDRAGLLTPRRAGQSEQAWAEENIRRLNFDRSNDVGNTPQLGAIEIATALRLAANINENINAQLGALENGNWRGWNYRTQSGATRNVFDRDGDGRLEVAEIRQALTQAGVNLTQYDANHDGRLSGAELTRAMQWAAENYYHANLTPAATPAGHPPATPPRARGQ